MFDYGHRHMEALIESAYDCNLDNLRVEVVRLAEACRGRQSGLAAESQGVERFIKFAIVGVIGAVVDFAVLNIMKRLFEQRPWA